MSNMGSLGPKASSVSLTVSKRYTDRHCDVKIIVIPGGGIREA